MDEQILNIILENIKDIKTDIKDLSKEISNNVVKKNDCEENREGCTKHAELEVVKYEWSYKKILAIGGVITATLTGSTVAITTILKAIYG